MLEDFPGRTRTNKDELIYMRDKQFRILRVDLEASRPKTREFTFQEIQCVWGSSVRGKEGVDHQYALNRQ